MVVRLQERDTKSRLGRFTSKSLSRLRRPLLTTTLIGASIIGIGGYAIGAHNVVFDPVVRNNVKHIVAPSELRKDFQREFGYDIRGFESDVEHDRKAVGAIVYALQRERHELPYDPAWMRIEAREHERKGTRDKQMVRDHPNHLGYFTLDLEEVVVLREKPSTMAITTHHEIKHGKVQMLERQKSPFIQEWENLAKDASGKSLYTGKKPSGPQTPAEEAHDQSLGFMNGFAREKLTEDVAYLCHMAEQDPGQFAEWMHTPGKKNERIAKKAQLAEKYKLLPDGFSDYAGLTKLTTDILTDNQITAGEAQRYLKQSGAFLANHKDNAYEGDVRIFRAHFTKVISGDARKPIGELRKGLVVKFKDPKAYALTLERLQESYAKAGQQHVAGIYADAKQEFEKRRDNCDFELTRRGVNDYLVQRGMKLPQ